MINKTAQENGSLGYDFYGLIIVDIDGMNKGKNTSGQDIFDFGIIDNGGITEIIPYGQNLTAEPISSCFKSGFTCTGWVIQNGNMDYLKADNSGKCPNGTVLSATVTSCK